MNKRLVGAIAPEMFMPKTMVALEKIRRVPITKLETIYAATRRKNDIRHRKQSRESSMSGVLFASATCADGTFGGTPHDTCSLVVWFFQS